MREFWIALVVASCGRDNAGPDAGDADAEVDTETPPPACSGRTVSFKQDVVPLVGHCSGELCHGGLVHTVTWPYTSLVGVPTQECGDGRAIVQPGDSKNSYLIQKLSGWHICTGHRMPPGDSVFPTADLQTLVDWICEGAPNN